MPLLQLLRHAADKLSSLSATNGAAPGAWPAPVNHIAAHIDRRWKSNLSARVRQGRITFERTATDPS